MTTYEQIRQIRNERLYGDKHPLVERCKFVYNDRELEGEIDISNTQRYKSLGNSFTVDVICHILSFLF